MHDPTATKSPSPLLMIGLDAAEVTLIDRWMNEGLLPNLAALRERGVQMSLQSTARWLVGAPWPTFYCSNTAGQFGMYHYLVWRPDRMTAERPAPDWMPLDPFWRDLPGHGRKVIAVDVPLCYAPPDYGGVEISGWATHELLQDPGSSPRTLLDEVRRTFGRAPFDEESAHRLSVREFLHVRDQCVETAHRVGELGATLMQRHPWDLALICFSSTHRGGHLLWDRTILKEAPTNAQADEVDQALRDVYVACDRAVGRLVQAAGERAQVMVFSLHGMRANTDRTSVLPEMLARVLRDAPAGATSATDAATAAAPATSRRITDRLRAIVPAEWRARVKKRLPQRLQDALTLYWRSARLDWSRTPAFIAFCDLDGYIRINLRGRERDGIVAPGDYTALREWIADGLRTFRDGDSGEPLVSEIGYVEDIAPRGPMRTHLPDMIVRWQPSSAASHRSIVSARYGAIDWPTPGMHPLGRSGNHDRTGFLIAAGTAFAHDLREQAHIMDLAPTALDILGIPAPPSFLGKSIASAMP